MVAWAINIRETIMFYKTVVSAVLFSVILLPATASADGLLGGLLGGGGGNSSESSLLGIVGGSDSGALVTINSGNADDSGLVNVGVGGSDGLVTANVGGGSEPIVDASVLGPSGIADVNANLGGLNADVNVGGPGGLIDIDIGGGGDNGGNGNNGNNGNNGGNGRDGGNSIFVFGNAGSSPGPRAAGLDAVCEGTSANQLVSLFQDSSTRGWNRASGIQLIPIRVCADMRRQVANWLAANGDYHRLIGAVAGDPLINAALNRTRYDAGHVLGVKRQGSTLMVYVF